MEVFLKVVEVRGKDNDYGNYLHSELTERIKSTLAVYSRRFNHKSNL